MKELLDKAKSKIINIIAKLDNGSHSSNQLQGVDEELTALFSESVKAALESVRLVEKAQLDKNDPDNYGACYAIAGWNHAKHEIDRKINKVVEND